MGLLHLLLMGKGLVGREASAQETVEAFERLAPEELLSLIRLLTGQALSPAPIPAAAGSAGRAPAC